MPKLLLISSSRVHGSEFLKHCRTAIKEHLESVSRILFVPYALADHDGYLSIVQQALKTIEVSAYSIHTEPDPRAAVQAAEAIFIGGGNTFRLLDHLIRLDLIKTIRDAVLQGTPYMGSSAGTNMACPTIKTTNDMPIVQPQSFEALGLIPFQINPHFISADPSSTHKGETREQRIAEYLEENEVPVVGIREGSWIDVDDENYVLNGESGAVWFAKGREPFELSPGTDISTLMR